ncbi:MAG: DUF721 domain-containing protein [Bacteroidales bacterium]|nr:DUF721 domain-containing protein [Bacteroidales bacterium]
MQHHNEQSLGKVIQEFLRVNKLESKLSDVRALDCWPKVVGPMISKHTIDLRIDKKTLYVRLDSDAIRNELLYAKSLIIKNMNNEVGKEAIIEIVFR